MCFQKPDYANIETAARNLLSVLSASVSQGHVEVPGQSQVQVQIPGQHPSQGTFQESRAIQANVQQEMSKLNVQCVYNECIKNVWQFRFSMTCLSIYFTGLFLEFFRRERTSGKRRFPTPLKMVSAAFTPKTHDQNSTGVSGAQPVNGRLRKMHDISA